MKSSTTRALVAKNQSTSFAQVATNLLNVLQGYTKGIRFLLVMFLTLTVSVELWGAEDVSTFTSSSFAGLSSSWSKTSSGTLGYETARGVQHLENATTTFTATGFSNVTKVQIWVAKSSKGTGSVKIQENTTAVKTISSFNTSSTEQSYTWTTPYTGTLKIVVNATKSSIYIKKIVVTTAAATTCTVTYDDNGATSGTAPTDATSYTSGTTVTVKSNSGNLAKTGHTFGGWNTNSSGTGTNYTAGSGTFNITGNTTLYAKWIVNTHTLNWDVNGGNSLTGTYTQGNVAYGATITKPSNPTRTGYTFKGWSIDGTNIVTPASTMPDNDLTYIALWTPLTQYTVTWMVDKETLSTEDVYEDGKVSSVPTVNELPCGDKFVGWTDTPIQTPQDDAPTVFTTVAGSPTITKATTFYAVFADYDEQ